MNVTASPEDDLPGSVNDEYECDNCGERFDREEAIRSATMGGLDATTWQTLNCPACGARVKTVFVEEE